MMKYIVLSVRLEIRIVCESIRSKGQVKVITNSRDLMMTLTGLLMTVSDLNLCASRYPSQPPLADILIGSMRLGFSFVTKSNEVIVKINMLTKIQSQYQNNKI